MDETKEKDFQQVTNEYAHGAIESLAEMVHALEHSRECNGTNDEGEECKEGADTENAECWHDDEAAQQRIDEDPLSIEVRNDEWHVPGSEAETEPTEYQILLTTGGPAARIIGELRRREPHTAKFEYQDWFKPWTEAQTTSEEDEVLLTYARCFYFGE